VDLSRKNDLTGLVAMYRDDDEKYSLMPFAYLPSDNLKEKSEQDRTPWDVWSKEGFLKTTPGEHICYTFAAEDIRKIDEIANIIRIAVDPYNSTYLKKVLIDSGFSEAWIEEKFFPFRQGFISMSPGVDELESLFIHNK
ncbi:terminase, partial [Rhizobium leguminosarum]|nr:terminase [Rhizobium leguminosarum]